VDLMAEGHELIVALGERRYRVERPFGAWPQNSGFVTDVTVDGRGHVFVGLRHDPLTQPDDDRIIEVDPSGAFIRSWGGGAIADTHCLSMSPDGRLFVVDRDMHEVIVFSPEGARLAGPGKTGSLGGRGQPLEPFNHPSDVAIATSGLVFVSDGYAAHLVHRFAADGSYLGAFGGPGRSPGAFMEPHALWAFADGRVAVVDRCNDRVQVFDHAGALLDIWEDFYRPVAIWGDAAGDAYVTDSVPRLHRLGPNGERRGVCRPVLNGAHGLCGGPGGDLYLAETNPSRVTRLTRVD
jgi:hypothetical protein